ncbi:phytoene desaturase family protein [Galbibacter pacificus]|uniref:Phytoene desaturase family protein n=1 Tax=Galbibacter pacificus TaxID=2996052 RepID=A0ABT6FME0_9FLAO|nr:phytoene desaturase family protein [Galbibacter pacificus]MDG3580949.1 phytoene desaturase family protein [Galbibacter pacificus]MDG3584427.1 phytoene desaturase family protein [Galbibacter pacificus]
MKEVIVIGSGFSSLSVACYLQKAGKQVTVLEKNEQIGGRASILEAEGFKFDMGPSWYWMPDIFERFFNDFGKKISDYYELIKLSPAYNVFFEGGNCIEIANDLKKICKTFDEIDPGSGGKLSKFINRAKENYKIAMEDLVYRPGISITELITPKTMIRLNLFVSSITSEVKKVTKNRYLQSILEFPVLFLGAKPENTPAFYNFMNYADFGGGTWYPKHGMNGVVIGMETLAASLGVVFKTNEEVKSIYVENRKVTKVITQKREYAAGIVVSGADYFHTEKLLAEEFRNYNAAYWEKKTFAPSAFLYYVGFKGGVESVGHHNLFFDTDFKKHAEAIYDKKTLPDNPLFYANFPSITDETLAPDGMSTAFFLIPIAVDINDTKEMRDRYFNIIMERFEKCTGERIANRIVYKKAFGVNDFKSRYNSYKGNAYGLANTLRQTSVLRPGIRNKKVKNLFYTGQLTIPGPGVPPALISGKIVSDYIVKHKI